MELSDIPFATLLTVKKPDYMGQESNIYCSKVPYPPSDFRFSSFFSLGPPFPSENRTFSATILYALKFAWVIDHGVFN